ncbi:glycoside hydrolase [Aestuariicella hydrocarbonica]|uniref:Glycoside hydrolase n=2 Tax=Pseudomaricurvus hydrocarbonicus TaxID=1470433 RepID=A0A9E5JY62_9GAMM|nr:glycoside hydrolase [Aestuariicella hydrocarbonica]
MALASVSSVLLVTMGCVNAESQSNNELQSGFTTPPNASKPLVWWHWMNGNVTKTGIKQDLQWMDAVGIGGVQNFDAQLNTPQIVDQRIEYMTPAWQELFNFALDEASKYNFEFGIAASPGWSETGGPWVEPQDGMKKLVWNELTVAAGSTSSIVLPPATNTTGPFQDMPLQPEAFGGAPKAQEDHPHYYEDIAVIAYPIVESDTIDIASVYSATGEKVDARQLFDNSYSDSLTLTAEGESPYWLQFNFAEAKTVRAVSVSMPPVSMFMPSQLQPVLQASEDGKSFHTVTSFELSSSPQYTLSFPEVKAKAFRLVFEKAENTGFELPSSAAPGAVDPFAGLADMFSSQAMKVVVTEIKFHSEPRVHRAEEKAGFALNEDYYALRQSNDIAGVEPTNIIDLTDKLASDGTLNWQPPQGSWRIIRLGYSLTGKENHPATPEATGLEVDKFDADAVRRYINTYLDKYLAAVGADKMGAEGIQAVLNDSIEVGPSNWTSAMAVEFEKRRGYALAPWLPALTGVVVDNSKATDAFLYDYRKTLSELMAENHYAVITEELHKRGLKHYSEALENGRPTLGDGIAMRKHADIPMAAMWSFDTENNVGPKPQYWSDIREAASVAHIYGQNLVAAESLTSAQSPWAFAPKDLQPMMDMEFALGVNRPIIHTSVHQPLTEKAPGLSLFVFGQYFNRLETWAPYAKLWVTYIARNSYMLRQGQFAADVAYFYGEEAPLTALYNDKPPADVPTENGFDYINADVILNELKNDGKELVTSGGARYKVIYLGGSSSYMTLAVLKRLQQLVENGAQVIGQKPLGSPALADDPAEFQALANRLWNGKTGKGKVIDTDNIQMGLDQLNIAADYSYTKPAADTTVMFVHRQLSEGDIYFYTNRKNRQEPLELSFRVTGKRPMRWDANTGLSTPVSYRVEGERTIIPRTLTPYESGYIVFLDDTSELTADIAQPRAETLMTVDGSWKTTFQADRGVSAGTFMLTEGNWAENSNEGIKYFSGTAQYQKSLEVKADWLQQDGEIVLDLGSVGDLAEVIVNGQSAGIAWKAPYTVNVKTLLKSGNNQIEVKVTNLWVNRLIGDQQEGVKDKITYTSIPTYHADAPLRTSGLIGPVKLLQVK